MMQICDQYTARYRECDRLWGDSSQGCQAHGTML